ncbi:MAG: hypothetical protein ACOCZ2_01800 [Thermodesulfobacteriota bacterium]
MMEKARNTINSAINENDKHLQRIERCKSLLADFFPLTVQEFQNLSEEQIEHIDQFVYRFTKLQDSMGIRLLPSIYVWFENDSRAKPFLDILNRLEQLEIIEDVSTWQFFRNLRNNLAHDYPESLDQTVETLNLLYSEIKTLEAMYIKIREIWNSRNHSG